MQANSRLSSSSSPTGALSRHDRHSGMAVSIPDCAQTQTQSEASSLSSSISSQRSEAPTTAEQTDEHDPGTFSVSMACDRTLAMATARTANSMSTNRIMTGLGRRVRGEKLDLQAKRIAPRTGFRADGGSFVSPSMSRRAETTQDHTASKSTVVY